MSVVSESLSSPALVSPSQPLPGTSLHVVFPEDQLQHALKRCLDVVLAALGLLALLPLGVLIACCLKLASPGPVFYKSLRIGRNRKPFYMYKFRTMVANADALRDRLREQAGLNGGLFKLADDPRVTPFGAFLRKYSLDELPQLLNVLRGEMSLVGPRPLPPDESALFDYPYTLRFSVLPGMTGAWQVGGRSNLGFESLCRLELSYVTTWSFAKDLEILLKTVPVVLFRCGAY